MKIIVFDDDPTGSQNVYGCPLLLKWDQETLARGLEHESPLLFILTNTRALPQDIAALRIREICKAFIQVYAKTNIYNKELLVISRGDSTLRGHLVLEPEVINNELGPYDATFHVPAFLEGGRTTLNGIHYLNNIPVHKTCFAKDRLFGYKTSDLSKLLEQKSLGMIKSKDVEILSTSKLDFASNNKRGMETLLDWLLSLNLNKQVVVDATSDEHLMIFANAIKTLISKKKFLFRSSASLIKALADLDKNPLNSKNLASLRIRDESGLPKPGLVLVGSHVQLADNQLNILLMNQDCVGLEFPVKKIANILDQDSPTSLIYELELKVLNQLKMILSENKTPVLFTSREEYLFNSNTERMSFGIKLAEIMARIVREVSFQIGYLISKGGITTQVLLESGLKCRLVNLQGQILPGLSVVTPESDSSYNLPIITFPGNLGNDKTLLEAWKLMENL